MDLLDFFVYLRKVQAGNSWMIYFPKESHGRKKVTESILFLALPHLIPLDL